MKGSEDAEGAEHVAGGRGSKGAGSGNPPPIGQARVGSRKRPDGKGRREGGAGRPASAGPTLSAEEAQARVSASRWAAFRILLLVGEGKGHSDALLHEAGPGSALEGLSGQDRNLATALVMGVLRWQIALDARLRRLLARPEQRLAEPVLVALRMGAFQLLQMDRIPAHAALSESVELCRAAGEPHAAGMVNAVLRKVAAAERPGQRLHESTAAFAERLGHPRWLVERWVAAYGLEFALAVCEAGQREPRVGRMFLGEKVATGAPAGQQQIEQLAAAGDASAGAVEIVEIAGIERAPRLEAGEADPEDAELGSVVDAAGWPVMDDGSRLVAEMTAAAAPEVAGRRLRVWDCCAAPGGKTAVLARRLPGAEVLATDISARRTEAMKRRLARYGMGGAAQRTARVAEVRFGVAGAGALPPEEGRFDLILCDVPCTGTGTLARNPEIRHRLKPEEFVRQAARQREILTAALGRLADGGRLVYSTCSLEPEECRAVVDSVAGLRQVDAAAILRGLVADGVLHAAVEGMTREGALRTFPGVGECDGFYAVVLERG